MSRLAYIFDYPFYLVMFIVLWLLTGPVLTWLLVPVAAGFLLWTLLEYWFHRVVLHDWQPFRALHATHHRDVKAFIAIPPWGSSIIFVLSLEFLLMVFEHHIATALMAGLTLGYLTYSYAHDSIHRNWWPVPAWVKRNHEYHHETKATAAFGVSSPLWDIVFGTFR